MKPRSCYQFLLPFRNPSIPNSWRTARFFRWASPWFAARESSFSQVACESHSQHPVRPFSRLQFQKPCRMASPLPFLHPLVQRNFLVRPRTSYAFLVIPKGASKLPGRECGGKLFVIGLAWFFFSDRVRDPVSSGNTHCNRGSRDRNT